MTSRRKRLLVCLPTTVLCFLAFTDQASAVQKFFIDFDSPLALPDGDPGKPIPKWRFEYSMPQTDAIVDYLNMRFGPYEMEFFAGLPGTPGEGSVIQLNSAAFGGGAEGVDFRNIDDDDSASINVLSILEFLSEDITTPAFSEEDIAFATANIVGHESLHLMGVRHHDAHGPIGTGIGPGTVPGDFSPAYVGPVGAPETGISFAAAHVGGANFALPGLYTENYVSERTVVKLEVAKSSAGGFVKAEVGDNNEFSKAEPFDPIAFEAPYPLRPEIDPDDLPPGEAPPPLGVAMEGAAKVILGTLDTPSPTGPFGFAGDYYKFFGVAGEKWTIEAMSYILPGDDAAEFRYADNADVALLLLDPESILVPGGINDDDDDTPPFGDSDFLGGASLIDVILPKTGMYTIEVIAASDFPVAGSGKDGTDGGSYELFVYKARGVFVPEPSSIAMLLAIASMGMMRKPIAR